MSISLGTTTRLGKTSLMITPIGLGTWAIGGGEWVGGWGSSDDDLSERAIQAALDYGINWIDTAPAYGLGRSEEVVGRVLRESVHNPYVFTKCAIRWREDRSIYNDLTQQSVREEVENSLRRLGLETIDLMQVHWPDPDGQIEEAWETLVQLRTEGKVRYLGVSNFSVDQMNRVNRIAPIDTCQPQYSLLVRDAEEEVLPYCLENDIGVIVYSPMASGLLTGKMTRERIESFPEDDWRRNSPLFTEPQLSKNLSVVERIRHVGALIGKTPAEVAIAWTLHNPAVTGAIVGARRPDQVEGFVNAPNIDMTEFIDYINSFVE